MTWSTYVILVHVLYLNEMWIVTLIMKFINIILDINNNNWVNVSYFTCNQRYAFNNRSHVANQFIAIKAYQVYTGSALKIICHFQVQLSLYY